jgi:hypothetical protein
MKIAMLSMEDYENRKFDTVGSSRIRCRWVEKYCKDIVPFKNGGEYDAVIYQKAYWKEHMDAFQGIKIFDICDPDWMDGRPIVEVIEKMDAITCPTQALADYLKQLTDKPVLVIPDRVDPEDHYPQKEVHIGRAKTVVWFGYSQNQVVLDQTLNILKKMDLKLVVISERPYRDADVNVKFDYPTLYQEMTKHDIVLLPSYTKDIRFTFKSNNKTLQAWAVKMPVAREIPDLERFMDANERQKEAELRYNEVLTKWHAKQSGPEYIELIKQIAAKKGVIING